LPASGKSTWAKQQIQQNKGMYKRVNKDDLRAMLDNSNWSKDNEKFILKIRDEIILKGLEEGKHIIVDDTNLASKHEEHIKQLVKGKAEVEVKFFEVKLEEAIKRDLKRPVSVGERVIREMYDQFLAPPIEKYIPPNKPEAYIFDIDGTLAKMNNRSPYDWDKVDTDLVNEPVASMFFLLKPHYKMIICTGRDGAYLDKTKKWLAENKFDYDLILTRPAGNTENDAIIKRRLFEEHIRNEYDIKGVFDDRDRVVEMWRSLGITCFQVDKGNF